LLRLQAALLTLSLFLERRWSVVDIMRPLHNLPKIVKTDRMMGV